MKKTNLPRTGVLLCCLELRGALHLYQGFSCDRYPLVPVRGSVTLSSEMITCRCQDCPSCQSASKSAGAAGGACHHQGCCCCCSDSSAADDSCPGAAAEPGSSC